MRRRQSCVDAQISLTLEENAFEKDSALSPSTVADDFSWRKTEFRFVQSLMGLPRQSAILASHYWFISGSCLRRTSPTHTWLSAAERVRRYIDAQRSLHDAWRQHSRCQTKASSVDDVMTSHYTPWCVLVKQRRQSIVIQLLQAVSRRHPTLKSAYTDDC